MENTLITHSAHALNQNSNSLVEPRVRVSNFLTSPKRPAAPSGRLKALMPHLEWFEWTDTQGHEVRVCLVNDREGGPPLVLSDRNGSVQWHCSPSWESSAA